MYVGGPPPPLGVFWYRLLIFLLINPIIAMQLDLFHSFSRVQAHNHSHADKRVYDVKHLLITLFHYFL